MATALEPEQLFDPGSVRLPAIASLHVKQLHGKFTYDIALGPTAGRTPAPDIGEDGLFTAGDDRLTLLYGRNGTGKTSILRLLFHALSASDHRGHRGTLFRTRFSQFVVQLTSGVIVAYVRPEGELSGPFTALLHRPDSDDDRIVWQYNGPGTQQRQFYQPTLLTETQSYFTLASGEQVPYSYNYEPDDERFLRALAGLGINPVFLSDSRAIVSDVLSEDDVQQAARSDLLRRRVPDMDEALRRTRDLDVEQALALVRSYLSQLVLAGTQAGSQRVDTVYLNVATTIVQHASAVGRPKKSILPNLRSRIRSIADRASRFQLYGLLPEFPAEGLLKALDAAAERNGPLLERVLHPYLDGLEERMDALEPGLRAVSALVDALNSFLEQKHVEFRPGAAGLRILDTESGEKIDADALSSGEKQIVLLFSDIVALQKETRVFIIDEPELSLNPRWQRQLIPALLAVTELSGMQLLAATHSIEIMAQYRSRLRRLDG